MSWRLLYIIVFVSINLRVDHRSYILMDVLIVIINYVICLYDASTFLAIHVNVHYVIIGISKELMLF